MAPSRDGPRYEPPLLSSDQALSYSRNAARLADLAAKHEIPTIANERSYAVAGCLMAYGNNFSDYFRRAGDYVDKILKGEKPADCRSSSRPNSNW